ncbi:xanthine dehydrogenase family protein molybdopterin-binding subunit [Sciscionella marina]|uniref:xanthine dehydrogenase family protein molybdopterin-binding subunit n=1 Tax=Sciscionella marina TaxID=508770 RepID=UPI00035EA28E|nr:xanthine dehydrogenase family protein molybdopterin-binding subunit [Sciscionella marina]
MSVGKQTVGKFVGRPVRKHDGDDYLTARATYTGDIVLPGTVYAALVRAPLAHGLIRSVATTAAEGVAGVIAVVTGSDVMSCCDEIPHGLDAGLLGGHHGAVFPLAVEKVVYAGEPVAAVVATSEADARAACLLVEVEYEPLPVVLDVESALAADAPVLYPAWGENILIEGRTGSDDFVEVARGAAHVLDGELRTHRGTAAPMEPRMYLADWDTAGQRLTLYASTQNPHVLRTVLATAMRLREGQVQVIAPKVGGSFGLKMYGSREDFIAPVLARMVGRPVSWTEERAASLLPAAREQLLSYRVAFDDAGRVFAVDVEALTDHGAAAPTHGWGMAYVGALTTGLGYAIAHCQVRYRVVVTNKAPWSGTKPFGKDGATLLLEHLMERVAAEVGIDAITVRRRNFVGPDTFPYRHTSGLELDSGDYGAALDKTLEILSHQQLLTEQAQLRVQGRYLGIGIGFELMPESADIPTAFVAAYDTSTVRMSPSGQVSVLTGVTSPGTGSDTGICQLVADELGVAMDTVSVVQGDTDTCPYGFGNISSRSVVTGGNAAVLAARDVASKIRVAARALLRADPGEPVLLEDGIARLTCDTSRGVAIAEIAGAVYTSAYLLELDIEPHLESTRTYRPANIREVPDALGRMQTYTTYPYAVHASVVEVDTETGVVTLLRHVATHDCGTVINPLMVDGQITGGVVMGLGAAFSEQLLFDDKGIPLATGFKTYLLPRAVDVPRVELGHLCTPAPGTPLGAKGVGEAGFSGALAAAFNAVNDAIVPLGARLDRTPLSPVAIMRALQEARR